MPAAIGFQSAEVAVGIAGDALGGVVWRISVP